jgi:signal transduction histidine kinase
MAHQSPPEHVRTGRPQGVELEERGRVGIHMIRASLRLGAAEEERVHWIGRAISGEIPHFVDAFYSRLLTDPRAMEILQDDARVIRLKRSLSSWFHELFTLAWDEDFERLRAGVGDTHVRIQLPTHLMVTSMAGIREDVRAAILRHWDEVPEEAQENARLVSLAIDMELALMLVAYRRRDRAVAREKDRMVYAQRAARRLTHTLYDRVDAALCYTELAGSDGSRRDEWLAKLRDVLRGLARLDRRMEVQSKVEGLSPHTCRVGDLIERAVSEVGLDPTTRIECIVEPEDLEASLVGPAVVLALEELAQNSARHARGGTITVRGRRGPRDELLLEVTDEGPGWDPRVRTFKDMYNLGSGLGLSFCELVAELHDGRIDLFTAPGGGAGVRITVDAVQADHGGH